MGFSLKKAAPPPPPPSPQEVAKVAQDIGAGIGDSNAANDRARSTYQDAAADGNLTRFGQGGASPTPTATATATAVPRSTPSPRPRPTPRPRP